jgi:hypothetical protein
MRAAKVDGNQADIVKALRDIGVSVKITSELKGFVDLVCGYRGTTTLIEVKDGSLPPSARKLTADEQKFHDAWAGQVAIANTPEEAQLIVIEHAKKMGVL